MCRQKKKKYFYRLRDRASAAVPNVFESFSVEQGYPDYYEQLFMSGFLNKQLYSKINRGVRDNGLLNLTEDDFYSCFVPQPPMSEQQKIADMDIALPKVQEQMAISDYFDHLDHLITLYLRKLRETERMKKALMQLLLTGIVRANSK